MEKFIKFLNCRINLSKGVFVPREETEFWTEKAIKEIKKKDDKTTEVLDIFSGSGCIGIAVLKNTKNVLTDFSDIDRGVLGQIKKNLELNKIDSRRIKVIFSDSFKNIEQKYDFILANPPYVAENRIFQVQKRVLETEPRIALFSGKNGLNHIRKLLREAKKYLKSDGVLFLEFDPLQKEEIEGILEKKKFIFQFRKDQFKKYRWLKAIKF